MVSEIGENITLLIALTFFYSLLMCKLETRTPVLNSAMHGLLFVGIAIIGMQFPIQVVEGIIVDDRTVM